MHIISLCMNHLLSLSFIVRILLAALFVGVLTSLKRLWLATYLGKRSYNHYGPELEVILAKMLMISQVSHLARQIENQVYSSHIQYGYAFPMKQNIALPPLMSESHSEDESNSPIPNRKNLDDPGSQDGFGSSLHEAGIRPKFNRPKLDPSSRSGKMKASKEIGLGLGMSSSAKMTILQLLEEWEEPDVKQQAKVRIQDILQFRQAVSMMNDEYPFTPGK